MKIKSFAKINLGLEVIRKREDNYHEIRTLFQSINLYDILSFSPAENSRIDLTGDDETIPWDDRNLIHKAVLLVKERFGLSQGIKIFVRKNIPSGKGLGGGSGNAAMTLFSLNNMWNLKMTKEEMQELGKKIGADVPYFLEGGLCLGLERGDRIRPLDDFQNLFCFLALPPIFVSTASVYHRFQFALTSKDKDSKINKFLNQRNICYLENHLEETVFSLHPQLRVIKKFFQNLGSELSMVSGSGSAVFGLFDRENMDKAELKKMKRKYPMLVVKTLSRKEYWNQLCVGV